MFDGYHKWLGIPKDQRPPTHYQLLGIAPNEKDAEVIEAASVRQVAFVRNFQGGPQAQECARILTDLAQARLTLLNPAKRAEYDATLASKAMVTAPSGVHSSNRTGDELADLDSIVTKGRSEPSDRGLAVVRRRPGRPRRSPLVIAAQCVITAATLIAAYYLLVSRQTKTPSPLAIGPQPRAPSPSPVSVKPPVSPRASALRTTPSPAEVQISVSPTHATIDIVGLAAEIKEQPNGRFLLRFPAADGTRTVQVRATLDGHKAVEKILTPLPGQRQTLLLTLEPAGTTGESPSISVPEAPPAAPAASGGPVPRREVKIVSQELRRFEGNVTRIAAVAMTPDDKHAFSAGQDGQIRFYDPENGRIVRHIRTHRHPLLALAVSPSGRHLISSGEDTVVRLVEISSGHMTAFYTGCIAPVPCIAFTPKGDRICAGDASALRLWSVVGAAPAVQLAVKPARPILALAVALEKDLVYAARSDQIVEYDIKAQTKGFPFGPILSGTEPTTLDLSPDGRFLIVGCDDGTLRLWDVGSEEEIRRFDKHQGRVNSVRFSSDGKSVVSTGSTGDPTIRLWEVKTGFEIARFTGHTEGVKHAIFTHGDRRILSGSLDRTVRLWDIPN